MKPVANVDQMRECDRLTIEEIGIPGIVLMETASRAIADKARELLDKKVAGKKIVILCGKGNNGGDGLAAARHLRGWGGEVQVFLPGDPRALTGDAALNRDLLLKTGGTIEAIDSPDQIPKIPLNCDLIIDAIFGTGFSPPTNELYSRAIQHINSSGKKILAVDIPSGVKGNTGEADDKAVNATETVTFGLLKPGLLFSPGREHAGRVTVVDIGIPPSVVDRQGIDIFSVEEEDVRRSLPLIKPSAHKGDAGYVYILAGAPGLTGAATLAAQAAMRSGAGLVTVGIPKSLNPIIEAKLTEAMSEPLPETASGHLALGSWDSISARLKWANALAFGPGIGRHEETGALLAKLLESIEIPLVIDADGLNLLAEAPEQLDNLPCSTILTPHPGEFSRLTGISIDEISRNRIAITRQYAKKWNVVLHLKGSPSITVSPDGKVYINPTGNSGMATGGSGDVLTGIIAALLANGMDPTAAAWAGAYIHGDAGDLARDDLGTRGMIAGDLIARIPQTLRKLI